MTRSSSPLRLTLLPETSWARAAALALCAASALGAVGCKHRDQDGKRRFEWIREQTATNKLYVRDVLTRTGYYEFYDGWYPPEYDAKGNSAWRWMEKRGIVRLRTAIGDDKTPRDMELKIFGWVPQEHVGLRKIVLELSVNGHIIERFDPPKGSFEHTLFVPRFLLENSDWVDFVITASNTARPNGDWRDLGFATTGFHWTPVGGS